MAEWELKFVVKRTIEWRNENETSWSLSHEAEQEQNRTDFLRPSSNRIYRRVRTQKFPAFSVADDSHAMGREGRNGAFDVWIDSM